MSEPSTTTVAPVSSTGTPELASTSSSDQSTVSSTSAPTEAVSIITTTPTETSTTLQSGQPEASTSGATEVKSSGESTLPPIGSSPPAVETEATTSAPTSSPKLVSSTGANPVPVNEVTSSKPIEETSSETLSTTSAAPAPSTNSPNLVSSSAPDATQSPMIEPSSSVPAVSTGLTRESDVPPSKAPQEVKTETPEVKSTNEESAQTTTISAARNEIEPASNVPSGYNDVASTSAPSVSSESSESDTSSKSSLESMSEPSTTTSVAAPSTVAPELASSSSSDQSTVSSTNTPTEPVSIVTTTLADISTTLQSSQPEASTSGPIEVKLSNEGSSPSTGSPSPAVEVETGTNTQPISPELAPPSIRDPAEVKSSSELPLPSTGLPFFGGESSNTIFPGSSDATSTPSVILPASESSSKVDSDVTSDSLVTTAAPLADTTPSIVPPSSTSTLAPTDAATFSYVSSESPKVDETSKSSSDASIDDSYKTTTVASAPSTDAPQFASSPALNSDPNVKSDVESTSETSPTTIGSPELASSSSSDQSTVSSTSAPTEAVSIVTTDISTTLQSGQPEASTSGATEVKLSSESTLPPTSSSSPSVEMEATTSAPTSSPELVSSTDANSAPVSEVTSSKPVEETSSETLSTTSAAPDPSTENSQSTSSPDVSSSSLSSETTESAISTAAPAAPVASEAPVAPVAPVAPAAPAAPVAPVAPLDSLNTYEGTSANGIEPNTADQSSLGAAPAIVPPQEMAAASPGSDSSISVSSSPGEQPPRPAEPAIMNEVRPTGEILSSSNQPTSSDDQSVGGAAPVVPSQQAVATNQTPDSVMTFGSSSAVQPTGVNSSSLITSNAPDTSSVQDPALSRESDSSLNQQTGDLSAQKSSSSTLESLSSPVTTTKPEDGVTTSAQNSEGVYGSIIVTDDAAKSNAETKPVSENRTDIVDSGSLVSKSSNDMPSSLLISIPSIETTPQSTSGSVASADVVSSPGTLTATMLGSDKSSTASSTDSNNKLGSNSQNEPTVATTFVSSSSQASTDFPVKQEESSTSSSSVYSAPAQNMAKFKSSSETTPTATANGTQSDIGGSYSTARPASSFTIETSSVPTTLLQNIENHTFGSGSVTALPAFSNGSVTASPADVFVSGVLTTNSPGFEPVNLTTVIPSIRGAATPITIPWADISKSSNSTESSTSSYQSSSQVPFTTNATNYETKSIQHESTQSSVAVSDSDYEEVAEDSGCEYEGKTYNSAQQVPRSNPCDFCFCFRGDIICLQQTCPPPVPHCFETIMDGFCCPRYECPVHTVRSSQNSTSLSLTPYDAHSRLHPHTHDSVRNANKSSVRGCFVDNKLYGVGQVIESASSPCLECRCDKTGMMKCNPKECSPEDPLLQQINREVLQSTLSRSQAR